MSRQEENMHDVKATLARIEARLEATATAAQVSQMETKVAQLETKLRGQIAQLGIKLGGQITFAAMLAAIVFGVLRATGRG